VADGTGLVDGIWQMGDGRVAHGRVVTRSVGTIWRGGKEGGAVRAEAGLSIECTRCCLLYCISRESNLDFRGRGDYSSKCWAAGRGWGRTVWH
jgi:hypothetical protein